MAAHADKHRPTRTKQRPRFRAAVAWGCLLVVAAAGHRAEADSKRPVGQAAKVWLGKMFGRRAPAPAARVADDRRALAAPAITAPTPALAPAIIAPTRAATPAHVGLPGATPSRPARKPHAAARVRPRTWALRQAATGFGTADDEYGGITSAGAGVSRDLSTRGATITEAKGRATQLEIRVGGRAQSIAVTDEVELERRVNLPTLVLQAGGLPAQQTWLKAKPVRTHQDLVINILDRFTVDCANASVAEAGAGRLRIAPLSSRYVHAHRGYDSGIANGYSGPITVDKAQAAFTRELQGEPMQIWGRETYVREGDGIKFTAEKPWATIQRNYIVGLQHESAVYWDTPDRALEQRGKALREKRWNPIGEDGRIKKVTAHGLFLKEQISDVAAAAQGLSTGDFTARAERHGQLPLGMSRAEVRAAVQGLAVRYGLSEAQGKTLRPTVRIENNRASVDLIWKADGEKDTWSSKFVKVGFMTIDVYRTVGLLPGAKHKHPKPTVQLEFELLPEGRGLYKEHPEEFRRLFAQLEQAYGARLSPLPKYRQGLDQLRNVGAR